MRVCVRTHRDNTYGVCKTQCMSPFQRFGVRDNVISLRLLLWARVPNDRNSKRNRKSSQAPISFWRRGGGDSSSSSNDLGKGRCSLSIFTRDTHTHAGKTDRQQESQLKTISCYLAKLSTLTKLQMR